MGLAANLKKFRARKNKSLQEVADAVGVSKPHIWQLEKDADAKPSLELLKKLANYYKTSIAELIGETQGPMVFGREFKGVDEEVQKLVIKMTEQIVGQNKKT